MICPKCGSDNVTIQMIETGSKTKKSGNGLGGNAYNAARGIVGISTLGLSNVVMPKAKGKNKTKNIIEKVCICQNCGYSDSFERFQQIVVNTGAELEQPKAAARLESHTEAQQKAVYQSITNTHSHGKTVALVFFILFAILSLLSVAGIMYHIFIVKDITSLFWYSMCSTAIFGLITYILVEKAFD